MSIFLTRFIGIQATKVADENRDLVLNNPVDVSLDKFADKLFDCMVDQSQQDKDMDSIITADPESWRMVVSLLLRHNKRRLSASA